MTIFMNIDYKIDTFRGFLSEVQMFFNRNVYRVLNLKIV